MQSYHLIKKQTNKTLNISKLLDQIIQQKFCQRYSSVTVNIVTGAQQSPVKQRQNTQTSEPEGHLEYCQGSYVAGWHQVPKKLRGNRAKTSTNSPDNFYA